MSDQVSRLDKDAAENAIVDKPPIEPTHFTKPKLAKDVLSEPRKDVKSKSGQADLKTCAKENPRVQASNIDQLLGKMLPPLLCQNSETQRAEIQREFIRFLKFNAAFTVEVDSREVYDATENLKFLLNCVEGSAKSCVAKFMPGSDKYEGAWTALE